MKKSALLLVLLAILLAIPFGYSLAQPPQPGTPQDNACNTGGPMAGKCDTEWEWICGWYVAQWYNKGGWNTPNNTIPDWCQPQILLPQKPPPSTPDPTANPTSCVNYGANSFCLTNNLGEHDLLRDGSINRRDVILPQNTTSCPAPYTDVPITTVALAYGSEIRGVVLNKGFSRQDKVCTDNLP
jgi:hypothetical protein